MAKISNKIKEVGVQKTCGALQIHLIWRYLIESMILAALAMVFGALI